MMSSESNVQLYQKMQEEEEQHKDWLMAQSPETILKYAWEYTIREDILLSLEYQDLSDEEAEALLSLPNPLASILEYFEDMETDHMENIWSAIEGKAKQSMTKKEVN